MGKDWNVARHAAEGNFVLVTNNASDFRMVYAAQPLHAGLVIIIPSVNRVLEVDIEGDEVTFKLYDLPADSP